MKLNNVSNLYSNVNANNLNINSKNNKSNNTNQYAQIDKLSNFYYPTFKGYIGPKGSIFKPSVNSKLSKIAEDALKKISALKDINKIDLRFRSTEAMQIAKNINDNNYGHLDKLLNAKTFDNKEYRFNHLKISNILTKCNKNNTNQLDKLLNAKNIDEKSYRFDKKGIMGILENVNKHNDVHLDKLLNSKSIDKTAYRFNDSDISKTLEVCNDSNKHILNYLIDQKSFDNKDFRIKNKYDFDILKYTDDKEKEFVKTLVEAKNDKQDGYKYDIKQISTLLKSKKNSPYLASNNAFNELSQKEQSLLFDRLQNGNELVIDAKNMQELGYNNKLINTIINNKTENLPTIFANSMKKIGKVNPISQEKINNYHRAINNLDNSIVDFDIDTSVLKLDYPRKNFVKDMSKHLNGLTKEDQNKVFHNYSFKFDTTANKFVGYPVVLKNNKNDLALPSGKQEAIENTIKRFTENNKISLLSNNKALENDLNDITAALPEFFTAIGKKQHDAQKYTLDKHQLKVLKEFILDPEYKNLSPKDKFIGKTMCLFHDISKKEGIVDTNHPQQSAIDMYSAINNLNMSKTDNDRVIGLIKNHYWSGDLANKYKTPKDEAFDFRKAGDFNIAKIFEKSDLKGVSDQFYSEYKDKLARNMQLVQPEVDKIHDKGIWLPITPLPKASQLKSKFNDVKEIDLKDVLAAKIQKNNLRFVKESDSFPKGKLKVISINDKHLDDFSGMVHVIATNGLDDKKMNMFDYLKEEGNNGVLSTSFVNKDNFNTFGGAKFGFVMDVDPGNIAVMSQQNMTSGYHKDLDTFKKFIFSDGGSWERDRSSFSNALKAACNEENYNKDYKSVYATLSQVKDLKELKEKDSKLYNIMSKVIKNNVLNKEGNNEAIVYAPKPIGLFAKNNDKIPENELFAEIETPILKYAINHDLPVLEVSK